MTLTLRKVTDKTLAFTAWQLADGSVVTVKVDDAEFMASLPTPDRPGRPAADARFLIGGGGLKAIDTADGWWSVGDCWEDQVDGAVGLWVALGTGVDWTYSTSQASDPGKGQTSRVTGEEFSSSGNRIFLTEYDLNALDKIVLPNTTPAVASVLIDKMIENHRSVTFDATANGSSSGGTTCTFNHTTANQSDRYIAVGVANNAASNTITGVTYNSVALTVRAQTAAFNARDASFWDLVAPSTGTNSVVVTFTGASQSICGSWTAYGVDQTTPRANTVNPTGNDTAPTSTISSATDGLVLMVVGWRVNTNVTDTVDATWVSDWNATLSSTSIGGSGAHKVGAASVTRTDTLSGTNNWGIAGAALSASTTPTSWGPSLAMQLNRLVYGGNT